jgi:hypothetical protein
MFDRVPDFLEANPEVIQPIKEITQLAGVIMERMEEAAQGSGIIPVEFFLGRGNLGGNNLLRNLGITQAATVHFIYLGQRLAHL